MIIRKLATRGNARAGSQQQKPKRNRAGLFTLLTLGAGIAAMAAASIVFGLQTLAAGVDAHRNTAPPSIGARTLFPPVRPVHKVVDVYDPAPRTNSPSSRTNPEPESSTTQPRPPEDDGPPSGDD